MRLSGLVKVFAVVVVAAAMSWAQVTQIFEQFTDDDPGWTYDGFSRQVSGGVDNSPCLRAILSYSDAKTVTIPNVTLGENAIIEYKYKTNTQSWRKYISVSTDGGTTWNIVRDVTYHTSSANFTTFRLDDLSAYANQTITLKITFVNISGSDYVYLDDVEIVGAIPDNLNIVTFNTNGGSLSIPFHLSITDENGKLTKLTTLPTPTRDSYEFVGWFTADGTAVTLNTVFNANTTVYARWNIFEEFTNGDPTGWTYNNFTRQNYYSGCVNDSPCLRANINTSSSTASVTILNVILDENAVIAYKYKTASIYGTGVAPNNWVTNNIYVSTDGGSTWSPPVGETNHYISSKDFTTVRHNSLSAYANQTIAVRITFSLNLSSSGYYVILDDIEIGNESYSNTQFTVEFDPNGGDVDPTSGTTDVYGRLALPTPTRSSYAFNGWFSEAEDGEEITKNTVFSSDSTIYAQWIEAYTVTFNAAGGIGIPASSKTGAGKKLASLPMPTKAGYFFDGWFTAADGGDKVTTSTVFSSGATIYAQWREYNIVTFNAAGGWLTSTFGTIGEDGKLATLPTPKKERQAFMGWFTAAVGGTKVTTSTVFSSDSTIYAQWISPSYIFEPFTDESDPAGWTYSRFSRQSSSGIDNSPGLRSNEIYRDDPSASVTIPNVILGDDAVITYKYNATNGINCYSYCYDDQGVPNNALISYISISIDGGSPEIVGDTIYHISSAGFRTVRLDSLSAYANKTITLKINFEYIEESSSRYYVYLDDVLIGDEKHPSFFKVSFYVNDGSPAFSSGATGKDGRLATLPTPAPTRNSYVFAGWFAADGKEVTVNTVFDANTTVYARWNIFEQFSEYIYGTPTGWTYNRFVRQESGGADNSSLPCLGPNASPSSDGYVINSTNPMSSVTISNVVLGENAEISYKYKATTTTGVTAPNNVLTSSIYVLTNGGDSTWSEDTTISHTYSTTFTTVKFNSLSTYANKVISIRITFNHNNQGGAYHVYLDDIGIGNKRYSAFTVSFNPSSGGTVNPEFGITNDYGKLASLPAPTKSGYAFDGWFTTPAEGGTEVTASTVFSDASTIYARWTPIYNVTFNAGGGTVSPSMSKTGAGGKLASLPKPIKANHSFDGWFKADETPVTLETEFDANTTVYAQWTPVYIVTLDANGGTGIPAFDTTSSGGKLVLRTPTKAGHALVGWFTALTGGDEITASTEFTSDATIYAQWVPAYTVTFDARGGTVDPESSKTNGQRKLASLPTPTKEDNAFAGWFTAAVGGTEITANTQFSSDATIYAHWIPAYTVTFNAGGGTVDPESSKTNSQGKLASLPTPTRNGGYTFVGWFTTDGTEVTLNTEFEENTTIYARWNIFEQFTDGDPTGWNYGLFGIGDSYGVDDSPGLRANIYGTSTIASVTIPNVILNENAVIVYKYKATYYNGGAAAPDDSLTTSVSISTNGGSTWESVGDTIYHISSEDFTMVRFEDLSDYANQTIMVRIAFTLKLSVGDYFVYLDDIEIGDEINPVLYTVTFDARGGIVSPGESSTNNYGRIPSLPTPERSGYVFDGWFTEPEGGNEVTVKTVFKSNATIYARWTPIYTVTFNATGGSVNPASLETGAGGKLASLLPTPTISGNYAFDGWFTALTGGDEVTENTVFTGDATIYARWSPIYIITFDANGGTVNPESSVTGAGRKLASLPTPEKDYYAFDGWFTELEGGEKVTTNTVFTGDATVYAHWSVYIYIDENGDTQYVYDVINKINEDTPNNDLDGWYIAIGDITLPSLYVSGEAHIILADNSNLTVEAEANGYAGINVSEGNSLTIYAQSIGNDMGILTATGGNYGAGIGGSNGSTGGTITINGGIVTATSNYGAGIGGGNNGEGGRVTINGGMVTAKSNQAQGIGRGNGNHSAGTFAMNGNAIVFASSVGDETASRRTGGILFEGDNGRVYGTSVTLSRNTTIPEDHTLSIPNGKSLIIPSDITLTNDGTIIPNNGSTITIDGTLDGNEINGANTARLAIIMRTSTIVMLGAELLAATGQGIEYAISESNEVPESGWQTNPVFAKLKPETVYYAFARSEMNDNFKAGSASAVLQATTMPRTPVIAAPSCIGTACYAPAASYYTLRGIPLGAQKPTIPGVYIEKSGYVTRKIVVR